MKFKFSKNLEYQNEAINAVVGLFDSGKNFSTQEKSIFENVGQVVENTLEIDQKIILKNLQSIQEINRLDKISEDFESMDFSVEMETGTGKTYVYLRTIFELNQKYGLKKFIILVPSVAIKEGVMKTLEQTREHFKEIYNTNYGYFGYDSNKLSQVRDFTSAYNVVIMIMTVQSFAGNERLVMRQTPDRFHGERPIDMIAQTRPVVIMDEPQNMESDLAKEAISDLNPLFKLRYSATHKNIYNLVYRLSPVDAYKEGLVKKIQVYGVTYLNPGEMIFKLKNLEVKNRKGVADVLLEIKKADGKYSYKTFILKAGDELKQKTRNEKYGDLFVSDIHLGENFVELSNGARYKLEEQENKIDLFRAQISETIKAHFVKQQKLGDNIKVLSLFFIDKVANYVENGILSQIFEEEFEKLKQNYEFFIDKDVKKVHKGYFASKKTKGVVEFKDSTGRDTKEDKEAYNLIMKNKEQLLSMEEGWDNPNIFQICTLRETHSEMKKRQEIGRGLRLPLDRDGNRIHDSEINILTVVANESYEEYTESLQTEFEEAGYSGDTPKPTNLRERTTVKTTRYLNNEDFKKLWNIVSRKTEFSIELDTKKLIENAVKEINTLDINKLAITVARVNVLFDSNNYIQTTYIGDAVVAIPKHEIQIGNIVDRVAKETGLTRKTVFEIFDKIENFELVFDNTEDFIRSVSMMISNSLNDLLINESIKYIPKNESWEISLFEEFDSYLSRLVESQKSPFTHIEFDGESERKFTESLEGSSQVKVYTKLPRGFHIDTPLGKYSPDWAIIWHEDGNDKLYLVRETKFGAEGLNKREIFEKLRDDEKKKILCGEKHFEAIGVNFALSVKIDLSDLK
jgi:type III restriction enzyme